MNFSSKDISAFLNTLLLQLRLLMKPVMLLLPMILLISFLCNPYQEERSPKRESNKDTSICRVYQFVDDIPHTI